MRKMINNIASVLEGVTTAAIAGHVRPDGDCVGSCMGLYLYLKENYPEIEADVYLEEVKEGFSFLNSIHEVKKELDENKIYDVLFILDTSVKDRVGVVGAALDTAKKTICVDHHVSNKGFADIDLIRPTASSASELLYTLLEEEKVMKSCAEAIYTGIVNDTGVFQYSCTTPQTMQIAAKLMETGINFSKIVRSGFFTKRLMCKSDFGKMSDGKHSGS